MVQRSLLCASSQSTAGKMSKNNDGLVAWDHLGMKLDDLSASCLNLHFTLSQARNMGSGQGGKELSGNQIREMM